VKPGQTALHKRLRQNLSQICTTVYRPVSLLITGTPDN
jgi:hypothetical protein